MTSRKLLVPVFSYDGHGLKNIYVQTTLKYFRFYEVKKVFHHNTRTHAYFPWCKNRISVEGTLMWLPTVSTVLRGPYRSDVRCIFPTGSWLTIGEKCSFFFKIAYVKQHPTLMPFG